MRSENLVTDYAKLPLILDVPDLQKILGISKAKAYELCHMQDFPAIRISNRRIKISRKAFFEWLEKKSQNDMGSKYE